MKTLEMRSAREESVQLYDWLMCGVSKLPPHPRVSCERCTGRRGWGAAGQRSRGTGAGPTLPCP